MVNVSFLGCRYKFYEFAKDCKEIVRLCKCLKCILLVSPMLKSYSCGIDI